MGDVTPGDARCGRRDNLNCAETPPRPQGDEIRMTGVKTASRATRVVANGSMKVPVTIVRHP
jgi:hypothetical protein